MAADGWSRSRAADHEIVEKHCSDVFHAKRAEDVRLTPLAKTAPKSHRNSVNKD
jgi:hypothetical protein